VTMANYSLIPEELKISDRFLAWQNVERGSKLRKVPVSKDGRAVPYNDPKALMTFPEIQQLCAEKSGYNCGISLLNGLTVHIGAKKGYLWCFDFDGFRSPSGELSDPIVQMLFRKVPSYVEVSPSGTGFKYFFVAERRPSKKHQVKFGPSHFAKVFPKVRKYQHREVEIFSEGFFLALTGMPLAPNLSTLRFIEDSTLSQFLNLLEKWAIRSGGAGTGALVTRTKGDSNIETPRNPKVLRKESLELVLSYIDNSDEQIWTNVCNALARVYQESGKSYFLKFSSGEYSGQPYSNYDEDECIVRYLRALKECESNPEGYRITYLEKLAAGHPGWDSPRLEYESDLSFAFESPPRLLTPAEFEGITRACDSSQESTSIDTTSKYTFLTPNQLQRLPTTKWRVKGLFPEHGLGSIYGPSGSGKSFLALDLMASIAWGNSFYGHKTTQCPVVYVALEGTGGIAKRVQAYEKHHKIKLPGTFRIVTDMLSLFSSEASIFADAVIEAGLHEGVIVIDTLAQSAPGSDENSSAHMGMIISNAQLLQRMTNSLVVLIHHTGKDASRGARGHSSLYAALDAALEVKRTQGGLEWLSAKVKDGASGNATSFRLERVVLGQDEDGDEISSCVAVGDLFRKPTLAQPKGKNQKAVLEALLLKFGAGTTVASDEALDIAKTVLTDQTTNTAQRAKEALKGLLEIGRLVLTGDNYALV
jgi:hypothetical protein